LRFENRATLLGRFSSPPPCGDRDQERDPAGHIPRFNFPFQGVLGLKIGAAVVDRGSKPVKCLRSPEVLSCGQFEEARLSSSARIALIAGSL
jgi:hypothetical protein